jgi:hypothetical protein
MVGVLVFVVPGFVVPGFRLSVGFSGQWGVFGPGA